jgi:hypothetical protein
MWYYWDFGWVRLKSLQDWHVSNLYTHGTISRGRPDLQQPSQERYVVGPFLLGSIPESQRALDAGGISPEAFIFLVQGWDRASADVRRPPGPRDVQSSAALRDARGAGLERPEAGGEKSCRLAVGSADMLCLAGNAIMSENGWQSSGHSGQVEVVAGMSLWAHRFLLPARVGVLDVDPLSRTRPQCVG